MAHWREMLPVIAGTVITIALVLSVAGTPDF